MKRSIDEILINHIDSLPMVANYMTLLSHRNSDASAAFTTSFHEGSSSPITISDHVERVFVCKTCNRKFPSFQALGGHRASHKKLRSSISKSGHDTHSSSEASSSNGSKNSNSAPNKPSKTHECSICGMEFAVGQALGGHMRRHRTGPVHRVAAYNSGGGSRALCLDLNLTPLENGLQNIGKLAPIFG